MNDGGELFWTLAGGVALAWGLWVMLVVVVDDWRDLWRRRK